MINWKVNVLTCFGQRPHPPVHPGSEDTAAVFDVRRGEDLPGQEGGGGAEEGRGGEEEACPTDAGAARQLEGRLSRGQKSRENVKRETLLPSRASSHFLQNEPDVRLTATGGLCCASGSRLWLQYTDCSSRQFYTQPGFYSIK